MDVLIQNQKCDQTVTEAAYQLLKEDVSTLRQDRDQLRDQAAGVKKADESAAVTLHQMEEAVTLLSDQTQWAQEMTSLRQKVDEGKNQRVDQISAATRTQCKELSHNLNDESAELQDMALRMLQLDDEADEDDDEADVTDATDFFN